jgi:hypothetical protein
MAVVYYLEHPDTGRPGMKWYGAWGKNPALTAILLGPRMYAIVGDYTARVIANYIVRQNPHTISGDLIESVEGSVGIGGFMGDRWVGQVTVGVVYAGATEYGRKKYAQYRGNENLRAALHAVLKYEP